MTREKIGPHLARETIDEADQIVCRNCDEQLCAADENYKYHSLVQTMPLEEVGPLINDPTEYVDDEMEFRQFYCPGCGTLLENEVILSELEPIHDKQLR
jgi:acetone carboxylase gamma subunit